MSGILAGLEDSRPAAAIVQSKSSEAGLTALEDQILGECVAVVSAAARFAEISPTDEEPPEDWVEQLGEKEAWKAFRVAQQAWLPKKDAAMGVELSAKLTIGIMAARSRRKTEQKVLQVNMVGMTPPSMSYKVLDEKGSDGDS